MNRPRTALRHLTRNAVDVLVAAVAVLTLPALVAARPPARRDGITLHVRYLQSQAGSAVLSTARWLTGTFAAATGFVVVRAATNGTSSQLRWVEAALCLLCTLICVSGLSREVRQASRRATTPPVNGWGYRSVR